MQTPLLTPPALECPNCGKHTVVNHHGDIYHCLNCNFKKDLTHAVLGGEPQENKAPIVFGALGFLLTIALFM